MEAISNTLEAVDPEKETFIVVPDRTTLQIEEMLFDKLNLSSTFNLNVVGLGNLALRYAGNLANPLSEIDCVMYVRRAIENKRKEIKYFKSTNINFCQQIYKLISQLKASSIQAKDIQTKTSKKSLELKLQDIKTIYEEFEKLTEQRDDPNELIEKFVREIEQNKLFEDTSFYFVGFDSFTAKHFELIKALCQHAKMVTIGLTQPQNQQNAYIYDKDVFEKIRRIATALNTTVNVISPASKLKAEQSAIRNQLFGRVKQSAEGKVRFLEAKNKKQEADFVAKLIAYEVFNGARYKDFAVAVSDLQAYKDELLLAFEKNSIPCYFDLSENASKSYCALLFKKIFTLAYKNFRKNDLLFILSSPFFEEAKGNIDFVLKSCDEGAKVFYALKNLDWLKETVHLLAQDLKLGAEKIVDFIDGNIEKLQNLNLDEKTLSIENQVPQILRDILSAYETVSGITTFSEMLSAIEIGLNTKEVSAIPSYYDEVYVGDITDSFFGKVKNLFVIGANAGIMPKVKTENSIFSDDELDSAFVTRKVEPTIKMINRRARFKLFSLLCDYENRLYVSYSLLGNDDKPLGRSSVAEELLEIFDKKNSVITSLMPENLSDTQRLTLAVGRSQIGIEEVMSETPNNQLKGILAKYLHLDLKKFKRFKPVTKTAKKLGLGKSIKPTEIEAFYDCPFKFFCDKILKLKENYPEDISPLEIGSIVHDVLEKYGKQYSYKPLSDAQVDKMVESAVKDKINFDLIQDGDLSMQKLKRDIRRICNIVSQEYANSKFDIWMLEKPISAEIDGRKFYGRVDRVDKFDGYFRVLDYKTGRIAANLVKELSVGRKLQLFAYAKFIAGQTGLKCGGVYYFDAKVRYGSDAESPLVGLTSEDVKDDVVAQKYVPPEQFEDLQNEAERLMLSGADYMKQGKFLPAPDENSCEFCKFKSICLYDCKLGVRQLKGGEND